MKTAISISIFFIACIVLLNVFTLPSNDAKNTAAPRDESAPIDSFSEHFSEKFTLEEAGEMDESTSPYWWVNSGAYLFSEGGEGRTLFGELGSEDAWQKKYEAYDASETDEGTHPQNIFRLLTRSKWGDSSQEAYYNIHRYILSDDEHRGESNALLLFSRYQDGSNLYYAGVRVDGTAVIKKKKKDTYYTMAQKEVLPGSFDKKTNPNLIPTNTWIGVRSVVRNNADGTVSIEVYIDRNFSGVWEFAVGAIDDGKSFGGEAFRNDGYAGIRTDFMDVSFDNYSITKI